MIPLQTQGTQAWDRYAYVNNNPIRYSDPSGHSIFDSYMQGWTNFNSAWSIVTNGNASVGDRALASTYVVAWGGAHVLGATGLVLGGAAAVQAIAGAVTATGATTAATAGGAAAGTANVACGGDMCASEVQQVNRACGGDMCASEAQNVVTAITKYYPPNQGFSGDPIKTTLEVGQIITRRGGEYGRFFAPLGTSPSSLSLPPGAETISQKFFEVAKPFTVYAGQAASWFGRPGGGTQYLSILNQKWLTDNGYITQFIPK